MIPRDPGKRIRIRRCLFATQFLFLATKILVSVLVTGDFISLIIQSFAFFVFFSYVPWALVCDFRTAKEVRLEWERIRKVRRGEEGVGESTLEDKGKKNRWRSDRAWQEVLFLSLQGACWLVSAIFAGIQGGPAACQQAVLQGAIINSLDSLVPDQAVAQFCNGMTANIALSCIGVIFTLLWLWWVFYSVKTLRKFEKTTRPDGQEVLIVREKVWRKSMARLLRRDEDDDVNGIKRIVTGGLVDLVELESRQSVHRRRSDRDRDHTHGHHWSRSRNGNGDGQGRLAMPPGFGLRPSTPRPSQESDLSSEPNSERARSPSYADVNGQRRDTEAILQSLPRTRGDMPPPPYIGQPGPQSEGTNTTTLSSSGEGTGTGTGTGISMSMFQEAQSLSQSQSPGSNQAFIGTSMSSASGAGGHTNINSRPLPLAPPDVERVVDRKMDQMASGTYTGGSGDGMDAFTATRLGLGPVAQFNNKGQTAAGSGTASGSGSGTAVSGSGSGSGMRMEDVIDLKLDTYASQSSGTNRQTTTTTTSTATPTAAGPSGPSGYETIEQLVDRKIAFADPTSASASVGPSSDLPPSFQERTSGGYSEQFTTSPIGFDSASQSALNGNGNNGGVGHGHEMLTSTWPGSNPPPSFHANTISTYNPALISTSSSRKGKAAEAGFSILPPHSPPHAHPHPHPLHTYSLGRAAVPDKSGGSAYGHTNTKTSTDDEMTLEEMIELKMASLRAQSQSQSQSQSQAQQQAQARARGEDKGGGRPHALTMQSGETTVQENDSGKNRGRLKTKGKGKGKRKGRPRAGSDPGPKLPRHDETDEEGSDEG